ncbi:MAG: hypothetical protein WA581_09445 [Candidatus Acidiferrales bacterium]
MCKVSWVLPLMTLTLLAFANPAAWAGAPARASQVAGLPIGTCARGCLVGFMDQYLAALVKHDPSGLPVAGDIKCTENTKKLTLGDGLWKTIQDLKFRGETVADPRTGQVVFFGAVDEANAVALLMVRLKVANDKMTEVETTVSRPSDMSRGFEFKPDLQLLAITKPYYDDVLPDSERESRDQLIARTNSYFDGIEHEPGNVPFSPECNRVENGRLTTNNPDGNSGLPSLGCAAGFQEKRFTFIVKIRDRRFPVVDETRGLVVAMIIFDVPGVKSRIVDGKEVAAPPSQSMPRNNVLTELFKMESGRIHLIQAFMLPTMPYGTQNGWN